MKCFAYFLLFLLWACEPAQSHDPAATGPNLLLILTDDQGYGDLGAFGAPDLLTPHLDSLVAAGMRFNEFYANCPVCSPTRASVMSGRYPASVGVPGVIRTYPEDNWGYLDPQAPLLSEQLQAAGYHTALIGKWHLGLESPNTPKERGFDLFHGWLGDMMDDYVQKRRHDINYMRYNEQEIDPPGHATDVFTQWAVNYLQEQAQTPEPFFLFLSYNAPHFPVQPPADWLAKVKEREPMLTDKRARLVAFIEHLDHGIGQVLTALQKSGHADNTLIFFTSDNGGLLRDEAYNGPLRDGKQSVYEGGIKVPACAVWPGQIAAGSSCDTRFLTMDIMPTFLRAAGVAVPDGLDGMSFLPSLQGRNQDTQDRPVFFSRREGGMRYGGKTIEAVRLGDWKLLQNDPFGPRELYHLPSDPLEQNDRFATEPEQAQALNRLLMKHLQAGGAVPWQAPASPKP